MLNLQKYNCKNLKIKNFKDNMIEVACNSTHTQLNDRNIIQQICLDWLSGMTPGQIALKFKTSKVNIGQIIKQEGLHKNNPFALSDIAKKRISEEYLNGKTTNTLSKENIMSVESVCEILKKNNTTVRNRNDKSYRKYHLNEKYFENIDDEYKAYWLGFLYADGYNNANQTLQIGLQILDKEHLELLCKHIETNAPVKSVKNDTVALLEISSVDLCKDLARHGCVQAKTFITEFPKIEDSLKRHFIRGYFDGDGWVKSDGRRLEIIGTESLLNSINEEIYKNVNINCSRIRPHGKNIVSYTYQAIKRLTFLYDYFYKDSNVYLKRKEEKFKNVFKNQEKI